MPTGASLDEVVTGPDGTRMLHVITPIANEANCSSADCHAHLDSGPTLGFLQAEYSLGRTDALLSYLNASFVVDLNLPSQGLTSIRLLDLRGRQVLAVSEAYLEAGHHRLKVGVPELDSGVYFIHLQQGKLRRTQKIILNR